jgi:hypothetical protein
MSDEAETIQTFARRGRPPKIDADTIEMRVVRGYFPLDGSPKLPPGTVVTVAKTEARQMIATGSGERANPLEM